MRTHEERVSSLHLRMAARRRKRARRTTGAMGFAAAALAGCLLLIIGEGSFAHTGGTAGMYTGAMMLFEHAGAYVLVALLAFMGGAVTAALLIRGKQASGRGEGLAAGDEKESKETQNGRI